MPDIVAIWLAANRMSTFAPVAALNSSSRSSAETAEASQTMSYPEEYRLVSSRWSALSLRQLLVHGHQDRLRH